MAMIPVPKPPKKAYNPRRPAGTLLQNQLTHLEWAVRPAGERKPAALKKIKPAKTEGEAARRIAALTKRLLTPPVPKGPRRSPVKKRKAASKRRPRKGK